MLICPARLSQPANAKEAIMKQGQEVKDIEELLRNVSTLVRNHGRLIMADYGVTPPQFHALLCLKDAGDLSMGELCEEMYLACSTMTDLISRLERRGLVERYRDPGDRRVTRVRLRPEGMAVIDHVIQARQQYLAGVLEHLSPEEKDSVRSSLEKIWVAMTMGRPSNQ